MILDILWRYRWCHLEILFIYMPCVRHSKFGYEAWSHTGYKLLYLWALVFFTGSSPKTFQEDDFSLELIFNLRQGSDRQGEEPTLPCQDDEAIRYAIVSNGLSDSYVIALHINSMGPSNSNPFLHGIHAFITITAMAERLQLDALLDVIERYLENTSEGFC